MYGLRQSAKFWQEHFAEVMREVKCKRCMYARENGALYILAYVDDLMISGCKEMREAFIKELSNRVLLKGTGELMEEGEHSFLGRRPEARWRFHRCVNVTLVH